MELGKGSNKKESDQDNGEFEIVTRSRGYPLGDKFGKEFDELTENQRKFFDGLRRGYALEDRSFTRGDEYFIPSEDLEWLNQKLVERHALPIERVSQSYVVNRRTFYLDEKTVLPPEKLELVNKKLAENNRVPLEYPQDHNKFDYAGFNKTAIKLESLIPEVCALFSSESGLLHVNSDSIFVVGQLYGNLKALDIIIKKFNENKLSTIIFLGGYLNYDYRSMEVLICLFELKIQSPNRVILLQSRYETTNNPFVFSIKEYQHLIDLVNQTFERMPVAAIVNDSFFCVNSALPGMLGTLNIKKNRYYKAIENESFKFADDSSFVPGEQFVRYAPGVYEKVLESQNLKLIIQSHSPVFNGYKWWYDEKLLSLFSTPSQYIQSGKGTVALVEDKQLTLHSFDKSENGEYKFIL